MGKQNYYYNDTQDNPCITFCAKSRTKYITLTTILVVIALGTGFGIGFSIKKIETKFSNSSSSEGGKDIHIYKLMIYFLFHKIIFLL